jgi:hypothetical protein
MNDAENLMNGGMAPPIDVARDDAQPVDFGDEVLLGAVERGTATRQVRLKGWDNVLQGQTPPPVPRNSIVVGQQVLAWLEEEDGKKRWWPGVVWDKPSARRPTVEMQPYNTRDRKTRVEDATFALVWWDPRAHKEEWRMVRKEHLQPLTMEVPMENVFMLDVQWRSRRRLPVEALRLLGLEAKSAAGQGHEQDGGAESRADEPQEQSRPPKRVRFAE